MTLLHERLKAKRVEAGMSYTDAAKASGVSRSYLYQIEQGDSIPTVDKVMALAEAYCTTVGYLVGEADDGTLARLREAHKRMGDVLALLGAIA